MSKIPEVGGELESSVPRLHTCSGEEIQTPLKINWDVPKKKKQKKKQKPKNARKAIKRGHPKWPPPRAPPVRPLFRPPPFDPQTEQLFEISPLPQNWRLPSGSRRIYVACRVHRKRWMPLNSKITNFFRLRFFFFVGAQVTQKTSGRCVGQRSPLSQSTGSSPVFLCDTDTA